MLYNEEDIFEQDDEIDQYTKALDDSDVDDIEDDMKPVGVPKELTRKKMKAPDSAFIRSGELLLVKFLDKKASGEKEIYLIDSKGIAGGSLVERYEKGNVISIPLE
ncbi:unnamed protein product [Rotaria sp. Silwood2]|nr:unnamed protein product [Rotaria sp. Silwood2]CAF2954713.1 unnamed protein product [Rotaria sp. Silwood2]CAF3060617.1 unnamed protein product [Rotaria sp. Silwood2]CAF3199454.1 unnamed protein product [Rotaria sp. Silwood2]